jgi:biotin transport system substrate-specific component
MPLFAFGADVFIRPLPFQFAFRMTTLLRSARLASVDRLRTDASALVQVLAIVSFALLTALGAQIKFYVFLWEVPITLQTLAVYGSGLYLGARNGALAQLLYLGLGLLVPVYAGSGAGLEYFAMAPTAGYLVAYPLAAFVVGRLSQRWNSLAGSALAMLAGSAILFTLGVAWLHVAAGHATWMESIDKGWLRFMGLDALKIGVVALLYAATRRL